MKVVNTAYCHLGFFEHCEISNTENRQVVKFLRSCITGKIATIMTSNHTLQRVVHNPSGAIL